MTTKTVPVTMRALTQRINRKLEPAGKVLKAARGKEKDALGTFYLLDFSRGVEDTHVDLESLGRELGALGQWESLSAEDR
jgi:hypothetical protein